VEKSDTFCGSLCIGRHRQTQTDRQTNDELLVAVPRDRWWSMLIGRWQTALGTTAVNNQQLYVESHLGNDEQSMTTSVSTDRLYNTR